MKRRRFITLLGGAAAGWPLAAHAQQSGMPAIGFLSGSSAQLYARNHHAFHQGLRTAGYVEKQNVAIEYRWADGQYDRLPALAADLIRQRVSVIAAMGTPAALVAKATATTIPVVFETGADPVQLGLVPSLNRPGGNVTGVNQVVQELAPKLLQIVHELLPTTRRIGLLINRADPALSEITARDVTEAAHTLDLQMLILNASSERDFEGVFAKLIEAQVGALVIGGEALFTSNSEQLAAMALRHQVPAIYKGREFAAAGGLISYGSDIADAYRLAGIYVGRILKGDKPADLPVQQATKVELYINLKTAKTLGITIPLPLSGRADELIE